MKAILLPVLIPLLLAAVPVARAADLAVTTSSDSELSGTDIIELTDFSGGVGSVDAKDGANSMIIQMMQPSTAAAAATSAATSRYVRVVPTSH